MSRELKPLFARVVVRATTLQATVASKYQNLSKMGFAIPKTVEEKQVPDEGVVVSIGNTCEVLQVGDKVLFGKWAAKAIDFEPGLYVMQEEDVIGIIKEPRQSPSRKRNLRRNRRTRDRIGSISKTPP
jgi:co-chaperonin GroES (HSP10)